MIIATPEHATEHGRETGEDDGATLYNENRDDYRRALGCRYYGDVQAIGVNRED
jgi:hypothetical protein